MAGPIRISILANAIQARREMRRTANEGSRMGRALEAVGKVGTAVRERLAGLAKGLLKVVGIAAQVASTFGAVAPLLLKGGAAVVRFGASVANAAPALLAFAAAGVFVKLTMSQIGPAVLKSLSPITDGFKKAGTAAGTLAAKGVKPLAAQFAKLGMPIISQQMNRIAVSTNGVVKGFLNWAKSGPGLSALKSITTATATAFKNVAPHVLKLATALGEMIGRIAGVSLKAGSAGLIGILDKLTEKLKGITAASVQKAFDDLRNAFDSIKSAVTRTRDVITAVIGLYQKYKDQIRALADAFAIVTIIFGGPVVALAALAGLLIRHADKVKEIVAQVKTAFKSDKAATFMDDLRSVADQVFPALKKAFEDIKAAVLPTLKEIFTTIKTDLIPAFGEFLKAMGPVITFFVEIMVPVIKNGMQTILGVIKGVITIITGIFQVFTGILTGDWSKCWEGIQTILRGAGQIIAALVRGIWNGMKAAFSAGKAVLAGIWNGLWALVKSAASAAKSVVIAQAAALAVGLRNKFNDAKNAAKQKMAELVSAVKTAISNARNAITSIDLFAAGAKLIQRLIDGIKSKIGAIGSVMGNIASKIGGFLPGSPIKTGPLKSWNNGGAGKKLVDLLSAGIKSRSRSKALSGAIGHAAGGLGGALISRAVPTLPTAAGSGCSCSVTVNFNGLVTDPVAAGREVVNAIKKYQKMQGRTA